MPFRPADGLHILTEFLDSVVYRNLAVRKKGLKGELTNFRYNCDRHRHLIFYGLRRSSC